MSVWWSNLEKFTWVCRLKSSFRLSLIKRLQWMIHHPEFYLASCYYIGQYMWPNSESTDKAKEAWLFQSSLPTGFLLGCNNLFIHSQLKFVSLNSISMNTLVYYLFIGARYFIYVLWKRKSLGEIEELPTI